jgi:hypothetical protein
MLAAAAAGNFILRIE